MVGSEPQESLTGTCSQRGKKNKPKPTPPPYFISEPKEGSAGSLGGP